MHEKEQWVNAIRDNSSEIIASIILADIEIIEKQQQEIKRLKSRLEEYQEYVEINHKEIERLSKKLENLEKLNNANYQSFIETNKIIIELEKWIKGILLSKAYSIGYKEAYKDIYIKLQELKGDESNEKI